jgi:hypothetical protein
MRVNVEYNPESQLYQQNRPEFINYLIIAIIYDCIATDGLAKNYITLRPNHITIGILTDATLHYRRPINASALLDEIVPSGWLSLDSQLSF